MGRAYSGYAALINQFIPIYLENLGLRRHVRDSPVEWGAFEVSHVKLR